MKRLGTVFLILAAVLMGLAAEHLGLELSPSFRYQWIVVHHTAGARGDLETIRRYHKREHGWSEAAYHLLLSNGSMKVPAGHLEPTSRFLSAGHSVATRSRRYNLGGLHICVVGNYEKQPVPVPLQNAIGQAIQLIQTRFGLSDDALRLHRDCSATACPGKQVTRAKLIQWRQKAERCDDGVKAQQQLVIAPGVQAVRQAEAGILGIASLALLLSGLLLGWLGRRRKPTVMA